ncbi:glycogen debranching N-terminal domain-containing protein [Sinomonas sp. P47F7]|uniref:glycogen debranching N-terminal domain-containing protein n=1 Tax=Sinomonas sp. P47F7 TaxID=3410987 RepID=UPI003BF4C373
MAHEPALHEAYIDVAAPTQSISDRTGEIRGGAGEACGIYHGELRALRRLGVEIEGRVQFLGAVDGDGQAAAFHSIVRGVGEQTPDAVLFLRRARHTRPGRIIEAHSFRNVGEHPLTVTVRLEAASDFATLADVKAGRAQTDWTPSDARDGSGGAFGLRFEHPRLRVSVRSSICPGVPTRLAVPAGSVVSVEVRVEIEDREPPLFLPVSAEEAERILPLARCVDASTEATLDRALLDLRGLLLRDGADPRDVFFAAGAPWYCTLFGRDALWAARFVLPLGNEIAMGTLRSLARRQALGDDDATEARAGKIAHVVREAERVLSGGVVLPALYYGSVDATPLWISLLHDAWRAGAPRGEVEALLPAMHRCLAWMEHAAEEGGGFLRYIDSSGRGLANQGWKDSVDGIRDRDGRLAEGPVALCEVQAYAHAAARHAAALMRAFGDGDPGKWEDWASRLAEGFRDAFWVDSPHGAHPAVAVESNGRPVTALTSNIGHLLGTGLCTAAESEMIADLLVDPVLDSGYGIRTMASDTAGYNPLGYHTGSVWPHDTIIAATGLAAIGRDDDAAALVRGVLQAAAARGHGLPELYSGYASHEGPPLPYPPSCRPQAWSAAAAIAAVSLLQP